jgi:hypothetical protein
MKNEFFLVYINNKKIKRKKKIYNFLFLWFCFFKVLLFKKIINNFRKNQFKNSFFLESELFLLQTIFFAPEKNTLSIKHTKSYWTPNKSPSKNKVKKETTKFSPFFIKSYNLLIFQFYFLKNMKN